MKKLIAIALLAQSLFAFDITIQWNRPDDVTTQVVTNKIVFQGATNYIVSYPNTSGFIIMHSTNLNAPFIPIMSVSALATNVVLTNLTDENHFVYLIATNPMSKTVSAPSNLVGTTKGSTNGSSLTIPGF